MKIDDEQPQTNEGDADAREIRGEHLGEVQNSISIHHKGTDGLETNVFLINRSVEGLLNDYKRVVKALLERDKTNN